MPIIEQEFFVAAPPSRVFDLSRSVDLHLASTAQSGERAVGGVTSGLLSLGDEVTWSARHFGLRQRLTSRIAIFDRPRLFRDSMVKGAFKRFDHDHLFTACAGGCRMLDRFDFDSPLGVLGTLANSLFLTRYMQRFLAERNTVVKRVAESEEWRTYLSVS